MPRIPRSLIKEKNRCFHVISRTTGQDFLLDDASREALTQRIRWLSSVYFVRVFAYCVLSNHFHLLVQMVDADLYSDQEVEERFIRYYGPKRSFTPERIDALRRRWSDLSEYVKEIKQGFSRWYNKLHDRHGHFWSERFRSVVVEKGSSLLTCMAYIDLNAVRAGVTERPESYRYCSLGYHLRTGNRDGFLSLSLSELDSPSESPLTLYRRFVYGSGRIRSGVDRRGIPEEMIQQEESRGYRLSVKDRLRFKSRYFTEGVVLGSREFVRSVFMRLRPALGLRKDRCPCAVDGLSLYSFRRLRETDRPLS